MKVSIAWIFDHIEHDWHTVDIPKLIEAFNTKTAEIEGYTSVTIPLDIMSLVEVKAIVDVICVHSAEWRTEFTMPFRPDAHEGDLFLAKKTNEGYCWVSLADISSDKEGLLGSLSCQESLRAGGWKRFVEQDDYILHIDNKSITHRPDLWGHRGLAREVAGLLSLPFAPIDSFLQDIPVCSPDIDTAHTSEGGCVIENRAPEVCKRFGALYLSVPNRASLLPMAIRLARVDTRPISALVDMTNYVMLELSQPMHAFDASCFPDKKLIVRMAKNKEKLTLLDEQSVELTSSDLVVADAKKPVSLAGVMGGEGTAIANDTHDILLESASFDAMTIRRTSARHHVRTESSARFEKSLDPNQNITAIKRFIRLLADAGFSIATMSDIISLGRLAEPHELSVSQQFIEQRLGTTLSSTFIVQTLEQLGFGIMATQEDGKMVYAISVPTYRSTKDVILPEDIVEEIGRLYGYGEITPELPAMQCEPHQMDWVYRTHMMKQFFAYSMRMRELSTYSIFDEDFLSALQWEPSDTLSIQNPVSQTMRRMVTTLVPNMLKAVQRNSADHEKLRFFELGRTWHYTKNVVEQKVLSGIMFNQKESIDFYTAKMYLERLFAALDLSVTWVKVDTPEHPWYMPYKTAYIVHEGEKVGCAGKVHPALMEKVCEGDAFIFELKAEYLLQYKKPETRVEPLSRYPDVERDISLIVPAAVTSSDVATCIEQADKKIVDVVLIDFFQKDTWHDQRSLTFRYRIRDRKKTLTKDEVVMVSEAVAKALKKLAITIR